MNETIANMVIDDARTKNATDHHFSEDEIDTIIQAVDYMMAQRQQRRRKYQQILKGDSRPYETI